MLAPSDRSLLLVDDDGDARDYLHDVLAPEGYALYEANDCCTARASFAQIRYDLCILDLRMPDFDGQVRPDAGLALADYIGRLPSPAQLIAVTDTRSLRMAASLTNRGVVVMSKEEATPSELRACVAKCLAKLDDDRNRMSAWLYPPSDPWGL